MTRKAKAVEPNDRSLQLIRLRPVDATRYVRLRLRMLEESPWAFSASPEDDLAADAARVAAFLAQEENALFAIEAPGGSAESGADASRELIAAAGVVRAPERKFRHRAKIWGVYVEPDWRGHGLGRAVTEAAVELARTWVGVDYLDLAVSAGAPGALGLYERLGFEAWGREPEATEHEGRRFDEIHMTMRL